MQNIWKYISNLGIDEAGKKLSHRTIVFANQLNFVMLISMFFLLVTTIVTQGINHMVLSIGTLRVAWTLLLSFLNLLIARYGYTNLSRLSLIFLPSVVFLLVPILIGYVQEEDFTYYPYVVIGTSIIPQMLVHPHKEKFLYWFSLSYLFLLTIFIDRIMVLLGKPGMVESGMNSYPVVDRINTFYPFYKIAQIGLFLFINADIYYLRLLNFRFEAELNGKNSELDLQNKELKEQKDEIERQKDELISKEITTWQKLVSIISHEIVNSAIPITNLAGMTAQMLEDESGEVQKPEKIDEEVTEDIHHSLKIIESRTLGLINFVKATKSLTDIPKPNLRKIFLLDLFERITILYKAKFKETSVKFEKEIIPPDLFIEGDLELIEQVIINLFQNALEAMQETSDPILSMIARKNESDNVQISISDNGKGISDEVLERIFLPFYSTKINNSGIGLSLSQQIMMLHHARLEVKSTLNKGTTFIMIF
jgi:Signal transduction histidine kinase regulating C4-dicarboxylate transport system